MKVAVYCASGHELVWGGGAISVMGEVAKGARKYGGITIGVIPERLMSVEFIDHDSTQMHVVKDMRERKGLIESLADGFIALPGGIGTLEELLEIWVGRYLGFHNKPIAILDPSGVYGSLRLALDDLTAMNFMKPGQHELVSWCNTIDSAIDCVTL
ncbi:MAG: TIGR00730 family Rossman fold protein [Actinobacteria bacterium]|nr:TIGR00730 family Rossman fold protein [Actinomycetota bacterium]